MTVQASESAVAGAARQVTAPVNLLRLITSGQMDSHIAPQYAVHDPASDIFLNTNGMLRISGRGYGYVATRETYRDYHLVIEFRWGEQTWKDVKGFRGRRDIDAPAGKWNRLEIIAQDKTLRYLYNGWLVNEAYAVAPDEGKICLQTEAAELWVRRFELLPLFRLPPPHE